MRSDHLYHFEEVGKATSLGWQGWEVGKLEESGQGFLWWQNPSLS